MAGRGLVSGSRQGEGDGGELVRRVDGGEAGTLTEQCCRILKRETDPKLLLSRPPFFWLQSIMNIEIHYYFVTFSLILREIVPVEVP